MNWVLIPDSANFVFSPALVSCMYVSLRSPTGEKQLAGKDS